MVLYSYQENVKPTDDPVDCPENSICEQIQFIQNSPEKQPEPAPEPEPEPND